MGPEVKFVPTYNFFVNLKLIFENIHPFLNVKMTFSKISLENSTEKQK